MTISLGFASSRALGGACDTSHPMYPITKTSGVLVHATQG